MAASKVALVTGGNNGIGFETVKALLRSKKSYHILLGSRSIEKGEAAIGTLKKEVLGSRNTVELLQVDLTSDNSIEKAFKQVEASPGHVDILINNAGMEYIPFSTSLPSKRTEQDFSRCDLRHRVPARRCVSS